MSARWAWVMVLGALIAVTGAALAGDSAAQIAWSSAAITFSQPRFLTIVGSDQRLLAKIDLEQGTVEFGPGASAEVQAREAWRVFARAALTLKELPMERCVRRLLGDEP